MLILIGFDSDSVFVKLQNQNTNFERQKSKHQSWNKKVAFSSFWFQRESCLSTKLPRDYIKTLFYTFLYKSCDTFRAPSIICLSRFCESISFPCGYYFFTIYIGPDSRWPKNHLGVAKHWFWRWEDVKFLILYFAQ